MGGCEEGFKAAKKNIRELACKRYERIKSLSFELFYSSSEFISHLNLFGWKGKKTRRLDKQKEYFVCIKIIFFHARVCWLINMNKQPFLIYWSTWSECFQGFSKSAQEARESQKFLHSHAHFKPE